MPSGQTHVAITVAAAGGLYLAAWQAGLPNASTLALVGGCLAGILITPDLDVDRPVRSHGLLRENAGLLPFIAWTILWLPYARLIPHRSWLSHAPVIGTVLRLGYLGLIAALVGFVLGIDLHGNTLGLTLPNWWLWAFLGLGISDCLHWAADLSTNRVKRLLQPRLRWL